MARAERVNPEQMTVPEFVFTSHNTRLFITGVPLSGKSTIAPLVGASISECGIQNMDILRLTAQMLEEAKPPEERNAVINYGSCDAYMAIGNGDYSRETLVEGFKKYSELVCTGLDYILPKLETQGARDMLFEGVQLMPELVKKFLNENSRLVIVTSSAEMLAENARKMFAGEEWLIERYSPDKLLALQEEILSQAKQLPSGKVLVLDNTRSVAEAAADVMNYLLVSGVVAKRHNPDR